VANRNHERETMLKKIALAAVLVATVAVAGASIARARAPQIQVTPQAPKGFCIPPGNHC
jgi:hypothetical protein